MQESESFGRPGIDRRSANDRRYQRMYRPVFTLRGQRAYFRRAEDAVNAYVDRYDWRWMMITFSIALLCCVDAAMTLNLISSGIATEVNPFMQLLIERDVMLFITAKFVLTGLGLMILIAHKNFILFGRARVSHFLYFLLVFYVVLIKYELVLLHL
ncbi:MAG: hypothetical protein HY272_02235 [Gammaproteobacteria bacterium]|nr:hypothetical protein [Gammaproteobacteria bacterium]